MTVEATAPAVRQRHLCSVIAREEGHDPIGTAWAVQRMLLLEVALPWPEDFFHARAFPPGLGEAIVALWEQHPGTEVLAIAPDRGYSRPGWTRVIDLRLPPPPRAAAVGTEYLVPHERAGAFMERLFVDDPVTAAMPEVERVPYGSRDLLVCTHGTVDACCAMFGYPLYRDLRRLAAAHADCRVWRSAHFGGHRFAPTVLDFPEGRFWGFLDPERGEALMTRQGDASVLRDAYRGWTGYAEPRLQVLEREALVREGWAWTTWPQQGEILDEDNRGNMLLRLTAFPPSASPIVYEGLVETMGTMNVLHSTDGERVEEPILKARDVRRIELSDEPAPADRG